MRWTEITDILNARAALEDKLGAMERARLRYGQQCWEAGWSYAVRKHPALAAAQEQE